MKRITAGLTLLAITNFVQAQEATPQLKLRTYVADSTVKVISRPGLSYTINPTNDSSRFSHFTNAGTVYILPQDNMPWLKPNTNLVENMPVKWDGGNGNIPNGLLPVPKSLLPFLNRKP